MRTQPLLAATRLATAMIITCLGLTEGRAQAPSAGGHTHPNGPHQTLPALPGETADVRVNPIPPTIPLAPPPAATLPPPLVVPMRPVEPPPPPSVTADAAGDATPTKDGLRVTFGTGSADLNPDMLAALRSLAKGAPPAVQATFNVAAYAAGTPDDPSTARRLALSRALAVRSVLIESGVPSPRIYVRALGASVPPPPGVSPDRVDVAVTLAAPPAPPPGQSAPPEKAAP